MATPIAPFGFRPVRTLSGAPWSGSIMQVLIPASDGSAVFVGDLLKQTSDGGAAAVPTHTHTHTHLS